VEQDDGSLITMSCGCAHFCCSRDHLFNWISKKCQHT